MDKLTFKKLIDNLDNLIDHCDITFDDLNSKEDLDNLSISELRELKATSSELQSKMDKVYQSELYHIIGMGNLDAVQLTIFCRKIKDLGNYRSKVKYFATMNVPNTTFPESGKYKCEVLLPENKLKR